MYCNDIDVGHAVVEYDDYHHRDKNLVKKEIANLKEETNKNHQCLNHERDNVVEIQRRLIARTFLLELHAPEGDVTARFSRVVLYLNLE